MYTKILIALAVSFCLIMCTANASPGELDTSFGNNGIVIESFSNYSDDAYALTVQPDGKILLAGSSYNTGVNNDDFTLVRYNTDGTLDSSFGSSGKVTTNTAYRDSAKTILLQPDGKILLAGEAYDNNTLEIDIALVRYNTNGSLDTSFGVNGKVITDLTDLYDIANAVAIQPDGKIVLVGTASYDDNRQFDFAVVRYNINGSLDANFGNNGIIYTDFSGDDDNAFTVTILDNGKILVGGVNAFGYIGNNEFALVRYNSNGSIDTSFGNNGKVSTNLGNYADVGLALAIQSDNKILLAGYSNNGNNKNFSLLRYNSNGSLDTSFGGGDGIVTTDIGGYDDIAFALAVQANGKILLGGYSNNGRKDNFAIVCYNDNGSLNANFGIDGKFTYIIGIGNDQARAIALQPDGQILLGGHTNNGIDNDFALVRIIADTTSVSSAGGAGGSLNFIFIMLLYLLLGWRCAMNPRKTRAF
jgi:uncharacterized delta-60 repeat protein